MGTSETTPTVHASYEPVTGTWSYIVINPSSKTGAIIDSVLDFDPNTTTISTKSADKLLEIVSSNGYTITHILETHAHADHVTGSRYLQVKLSAEDKKPLIGIGKRIKAVQQTFAARYGVPASELENAFDVLFDDDETVDIGGMQMTVLHLPGHTPDHVGYVVDGNVFTGDSLFNPDVGSARCDFPGGSAEHLFASVEKLLALPDNYRLYTGHDYPPKQEGNGAREPLPYSTVAEQRRMNKHVGSEKNLEGREGFIRWRAERDGQLGEPRLLHQSLQVNIRGGRLPPKNEFGMVMLTVPVKGVDRVFGN